MNEMKKDLNLYDHLSRFPDLSRPVVARIARFQKIGLMVWKDGMSRTLRFNVIPSMDVDEFDTLLDSNIAEQLNIFHRTGWGYVMNPFYWEGKIVHPACRTSYSIRYYDGILAVLPCRACPISISTFIFAIATVLDSRLELIPSEKKMQQF